MSQGLAPLRVGVIGFSAQSFDEDQARRILMDAFKQIKRVEGGNVEIVSGLTWQGIPGLAYEIATAFDFQTVGIACAKARDYECFPCDRTHIIGQSWGDESATFLNSIDYLIKVGGGRQSEIEFQAAIDMGIPVEEFCLSAIAA